MYKFDFTIFDHLNRVISQYKKAYKINPTKITIHYNAYKYYLPYNFVYDNIKIFTCIDMENQHDFNIVLEPYPMPDWSDK